MKMSISLTLTLLPLLLLLTTDTAAQPVFDTDGHEVQAGQRYYIVSSAWGQGHGGLAVSPTDENNDCTYDVQFIAEESNITACGTFLDIPVALNPVTRFIFERIQVGSPLQIAFPDLGRHCTGYPHNWMVDYIDEDTGYVSIRTISIGETLLDNEWWEIDRKPCSGSSRCPLQYTISYCIRACPPFGGCPGGMRDRCRFLDFDEGETRFTNDQQAASALRFQSSTHSGGSNRRNRKAKSRSSVSSA